MRAYMYCRCVCVCVSIMRVLLLCIVSSTPKGQVRASCVFFQLVSG